MRCAGVEVAPFEADSADVSMGAEQRIQRAQTREPHRRERKSSFFLLSPTVTFLPEGAVVGF